MTTQLGLSGFRRNGLSALYSEGKVSACEEGRARRVRDVGLGDTGWPTASIQLLLGPTGLRELDWRTGEAAIYRKFDGGTLIDHHLAHARTSFLTSGFSRACVLICDSHAGEPESLWMAETSGLTKLPLPLNYAAGIAGRFSEKAREAGIGAKQLETLARQPQQRLAQETLDQSLDVLLSLASGLSTRSDQTPLCVGGGLFLNGYLNFQLRRSGLFPAVYVPPDPSNSGIGVGCAFPNGAGPMRLDPFIGPAFEDEEVKRILDNCKLTYRYMSEDDQLDTAVAELQRGKLVGCFKGELEWGPRSLGNRSIYANPFTRYVSENLNLFLKHRPVHETYSLSVLDEDMPRLFQRYVQSPYMEAEAEIVKGDKTLTNVTGTALRVRVQTVTDNDNHLHRLLMRFRAATGIGVLVNTSFNGFHEPVVVTPRDAIRVFFGTGLDALAIGRFWLEK